MRRDNKSSPRGKRFETEIHPRYQKEKERKGEKRRLNLNCERSDSLSRSLYMYALGIYRVSVQGGSVKMRIAWMNAERNDNSR